MSRAVDRDRLPAPGAPVSIALPRLEKSTLSNGMRVWTMTSRRLPLVAFALVITRGAAADPPGREGLAALTADLLDEGAGDRTAIQLQQAFADVGTRLDVDTTPDATSLSATILSRFFDRGVSLLGDIVVRPTLGETDFARVRALRRQRLASQREVPAVVADQTFVELLYANHPYGHAAVGTEFGLAATTADDVRTFHARMFRPGAATLVVVGDCDHGEVVRIATERFGAWHGAAAAIEITAQLSEPPRVALLPRPRAPQSEIRIGAVAAARGCPEYHVLQVGNMVLGGQFTARLNQTLRQSKGLTYGAYSSFEYRRAPGPFMLRTAVTTSSTAEAVDAALDEIEAIADARPPSSDELAAAIDALTRGYAREFETAEQLARAIAQLATYDLPDDEFATFVPRTRQSERVDVQRQLARYLAPDRLTTLVVGDPDRMGDSSRRRLGDARILSPGDAQALV